MFYTVGHKALYDWHSCQNYSRSIELMNGCMAFPTLESAQSFLNNSVKLFHGVICQDEYAVYRLNFHSEYSPSLEPDQPYAIITHPAICVPLDKTVPSVYEGEGGLHDKVFRHTFMDHLYRSGNNMIYTVGCKAVYDSLFLGHPSGFKKIKGGSVWETRDEAQAYLDRNPTLLVNGRETQDSFAVYGIMAEWHETESEGDDVSYRALTRDALCIKL